ncbi:helix-turn-helix domain-containing protein [Paracoccus aminophilus]|uniref:Transcriptional regulator, XRE family n=1 Tax=Paracoccus aminophilus JCM 7686 TaxID=1367847 RepID=S5YI22_PARAH|nr:helix-turn-helix domain-containing protein [Paracoccus aminophilus]AGT11113.1 transcriptional regulator, XRE family [Paracoccus aminophilus JCM 7686]
MQFEPRMMDDVSFQSIDDLTPSAPPQDGGLTGNLEVAIGRALRELRRERGETLTSLAEQTGLSNSMISRVEHAQASASLTTLQLLSEALDVPITSFLKYYKERFETQHIKASEMLHPESDGAESSPRFRLSRNAGVTKYGVSIEPSLVTLSKENLRNYATGRDFGMGFIYMLEGGMDYTYGKECFKLDAGDSLIFDADMNHGVGGLRKGVAKFLEIAVFSVKE